ncbi:MAG: aspartate aminotransferase family protein [Deltaproteobacteria bacterium]|nr:aspartate aminotransferase family protein [Deltaproteobacteria bacterium]
MSSSRDNFDRHLAQTSDTPIGLEIDRAEGSWIYTTDGRRYLDLIAGIGVSALGHGNARVLSAIADQAQRHLHVMVYGEYVIDTQAKLAARLAELLPPNLGRIYFTNSGAEAIEGALKTARKHTGRAGFVAFDGAYHGDTCAALALMGNATFRAPFEPLPGPVRHLSYNDVDALHAIDDTIAAVVIEPVQAEGGVRIPDRSFMIALREHCDDAGAVLIFDEVLTGFGRTGRLFALEHFGVVPDIIVLAKALGGGLPLGAFCGSDDLIGKLARNPPLGHITTFGGHPLSCAAGFASLETIVEERLWESAERIGAMIRSGVAQFAGEEIIDVRALGALVGIEFASADVAHRFVAETIARGVIVNWTLNADRVVRLAPPLIITDEETVFGLNAMRAALDGIRGGA